MLFRIWRLKRQSIAVFVFFVAGSVWAALDGAMLEHVRQTYGEAAFQRLALWQKTIRENKDAPILLRMEKANDFFNRVHFVEDSEHWKKEDYWATPLEMLVSNGGDCEDYSIGKFFTLIEMGIPENHLLITYVKSMELDQAHMVLIYAPPGEAPLVLDNLDKRIRPAAERKDLKPIYSFNGRGLWKSKERGQGQLIGGSDKIEPWKVLGERLNHEMMQLHQSGKP